MPRDGAFILSDVLGPTLSIGCEPCGRHETYKVARLMERYGDAKMTDLLQNRTQRGRPGLSPPLCAFDSQTADRLSDLRQPVGEIRAIAGPKDHSSSLLAGDDPVSVVLDLVQPARARRRFVDETRLTRDNETSRRTAPRTCRGDTPEHAAVCRGRTTRMR